MLKRVSECIVAWQINKGILKEQDKSIYQYGYQLLLAQSINFLLAFLIAIVFRAYDVVAIFLLTYIPLRSFGGGYHARTNFGCTIVSACMLCGVCLSTQYFQESCLAYLYPISFIVSGYYIFKHVPVEDKNKPLDGQEIVIYRKKSRLIWSIQVLIGLMLYLFEKKYGIIIAIAQLILSVMLFLGIKKNSVYIHK